jgi:glucan 1,6-alpha-glucosidase
MLMSQHTEPWWKSAVIYQIYPRSYMDSNGDGFGDLPGIISKLDYLAELGIDAVWLSPVFRSPQDDNGYDISDYRDIDPMFGTLADMDRLIAEAKKRGIRIILDLVLNHSSDEHRWFREAKRSRNSPYHNYYIWRDGEPGSPPDDTRAAFGGSAWEWVPEVEQFYYHQFSVKQPDLNWDNPALREELYDMIRWWADRGVGGFRLDVVDHLGKDPDQGIRVAGPRLHERVKEMSLKAFHGRDLVTVGEAWSATPDSARLYSNPDGSELSMVFQFEHIKLDQKPGGTKWDLRPLPFLELKEVLSRWQKELKDRGWNSLFWENHDLPRIVSRWGDDRQYREVSAKMLAILLFGFQGTAYIYQGQELGMANPPYELTDYRDIEILNGIRELRAKGLSDAEILRIMRARGRDNARSPMQWNREPNAGFTAGTPWLPVNPDYLQINAEDERQDANSVWACYRQLVSLRKSLTILRDGDYRLLLPDHEHIFAYERSSGGQKLLVVCNFHGETVRNPLRAREEGMRLLIGNYALDGGAYLRPYEARMWLSHV